VKKLLLITLLLTISLFGDKVIYLSYNEVPQRVVKGEFSHFTLKSISTLHKYKNIKYSFSNYSGITLLNKTPSRVKRGKYYYDTFNFLVTKKYAKLPDVKASLTETNAFEKSKIRGAKLSVITLNPKKNFSNIIADSFELLKYKTTSYDNTSNIVIFIAKATRANLRAIKFQNVNKQGIESIKASVHNSRVIYYVVLPKDIEKFSFSYFNLQKNKFTMVNIPIIVIDDSVVTQSDLKPKDQSHVVLKMELAAGVALLGFIFILWRKKYLYLVFILIPLAYIVYAATPEQEVCIKKGSSLHLLPVHNGTIFETTTTSYNLPKEGSAKGFVKVKLDNDKIGWVKNEDICSH